MAESISIVIPVYNEVESLPHLYLVGSSGDRDYLEHIRSCAGRDTLNLASRTSLKGLAHILKRSSAMVTVDSGPMHLAAAVGCRVVALFGPTAPGRTGPY